MMETEMRVTQPQARNAWSPQELEEGGRILPWGLWREHSPVTHGF